MAFCARRRKKATPCLHSDTNFTVFAFYVRYTGTYWKNWLPCTARGMWNESEMMCGKRIWRWAALSSSPARALRPATASPRVSCPITSAHSVTVKQEMHLQQLPLSSNCSSPPPPHPPPGFKFNPRKSHFSTLQRTLTAEEPPTSKIFSKIEKKNSFWVLMGFWWGFDGVFFWWSGMFLAALLVRSKSIIVLWDRSKRKSQSPPYLITTSGKNAPGKVGQMQITTRRITFHLSRLIPPVSEDEKSVLKNQMKKKTLAGFILRPVRKSQPQ